MLEGFKKGKKEKKAFKVPHVYVIIFTLLVIATLFTYIIPAGEYNRVEDPVSKRIIVDPNSYHRIEQAPVNLFRMFEAIPQSISQVVDIIFLVVLVSASFEIIKSTGTFTAGSYQLAKKLEGKEMILLAGTTIMFACMGAFLGWAEGLLVFIPLGISLANAMGADALVGVGMVILGGMAGFSSGVLNVYTTGVAQTICGLPLFSGLEYRLFVLVVFTTIVVIWLIRYTKMIKKDPTKSLVYHTKTNSANIEIDINDHKFTLRHKLILVIVLIGFVAVTYGAVKGGWTLKDRMAAFIIMGVAGGIVGGLKADEMANQFAKGARIIIPSALTIGFARSIMLVLQGGFVMDTMVRFLASGLKWVPSTIVAGVMVFVQAAINFLINSGSGQATVTMPIIAPLCDIINIPKQVAVLAFQFGDGLTNAVWPTSGTLMGGLALGGEIPLEIWTKWTWKLMLTLHVTGSILVMIAYAINLGPF